MPAKPLILFRADAGVHIGLGHLMRCFALAQSWQDSGGQCVFLSGIAAEMIHRRLESDGMPVVAPAGEPGSEADAQAVVALAQERSAQWVVVDGYHFSTQYQAHIRSAGLKLLVIDDYAHAGRYVADLVLNQNPHAAADLYGDRNQRTRLLLGTRYALLRREFLSWQVWERTVASTAITLLVTTGGADPGGASKKVIEALAGSPLRSEVVTGAANQEAEASPSGQAQRITRHHVPANMAEMMASADMAVSGGGSTLLELCFMQVPTIALILADNQRPGAERLGALGVTQTLGGLNSVSRKQLTAAIETLRVNSQARAAMASAGRKLVDGQGAARVVMHLQDRQLRLRRALPTDCRLVWTWANEPEVRQASFRSDPIPWETHVAWFNTKLREPKAVFYLAVNRDDVPVAQLRYDLQGREAVVSISIDRAFRGQGHGRIILNLGSEAIFGSTAADVVHAYIKPGNESSVRAFVAAGYEDGGTQKMHGQEALHFVLRRDRGAAA